MSKKSYTIRLSSSAKRGLKKFYKKTKEIIEIQIDKLTINPKDKKNVIKMKGCYPPHYRLRVKVSRANIRVVYEVDDKCCIVSISEILKRGDKKYDNMAKIMNAKKQNNLTSHFRRAANLRDTLKN